MIPLEYAGRKEQMTCKDASIKALPRYFRKDSKPDGTYPKK
jgi:hypothetical protein